MNTLLSICTGAVLMSIAAAAVANDSVVRTHTLEVVERLQYLELINVTSDKPVNPHAEVLDEELLAILEEAALNDEDAPESAR
jgi:hypothetical protein